MTSQLTRIAQLPGSGAGSTSALRAETVRVEKKAEAPLPAWAQLIVDVAVQKAVAAAFVKVLAGEIRNPSTVRQYGKACPFKFSDKEGRL